MLRKKWFTLIEILLVVMISASIIVTMYRLLETLPKVKNFNDARQTLIQQTNDAMDRFAILFQDYTVDYEEYFNRKNVGCTLKNWYCKERTHYGNWNTNHQLKYSSTCSNTCSFGEYKNTFWYYGTDTDWDWSPVWDADDRDRWEGVDAIDPSNIKELYLISHDGYRRIFLRRYLHEYTWDNKKYGSWYYWIQMLKLRWFDAWSTHKVDAASDSGVFDGQVDTWACDIDQMFICTWADVNTTIYPWFKLPGSIDDWWVDLFDEKINILNWKIDIFPIRNPDYARARLEQQINPYIKISLTAWLSDHLASNRNWSWTGNFQYTLENIFDTKGFYIQ